MSSGNGSYVLPNVLDVVGIEFLTAQPSQHQPENWRIAGTEWQWLRKANPADIEVSKRRLTDDPEMFRGYERYVTEEEVGLRPPESSLRLVKPESLWWKPKIGKHGRRG
jgi:hypothetical protein